MASERRST